MDNMKQSFNVISTVKNSKVSVQLATDLIHDIIKTLSLEANVANTADPDKCRVMDDLSQEVIFQYDMLRDITTNLYTICNLLGIPQTQIPRPE